MRKTEKETFQEIIKNIEMLESLELPSIEARLLYYLDLDFVMKEFWRKVGFLLNGLNNEETRFKLELTSQYSSKYFKFSETYFLAHFIFQVMDFLIAFLRLYRDSYGEFSDVGFFINENVFSIIPDSRQIMFDLSKKIESEVDQAKMGWEQKAKDMVFTEMRHYFKTELTNLSSSVSGKWVEIVQNILASYMIQIDELEQRLSPFSLHECVQSLIGFKKKHAF